MSKWCLTLNFQQLITAVNNLEQHIGLITADDDVTVNGRLNNLKRGRNIDGGRSDSVYTPLQVIDGGNSLI